MLATLTMLSFAVAGAAGPGWRHDGTARFPDGRLPTWDPAAAIWSADLPAWGNASPVPVGDLVCTTAEPTTVVCVDATTGAVRWTATNDRLDTVGTSERAEVEARLAQADRLDARVDDAVRELSALRRDLRRSDAPADVAERLAATSARLNALRAEQADLAAWRTPPVLDMIGYASATPTTDGRDVFVLTGNGVVSRFAHDGTRRWSVWLGEARRPMKGYDMGSVSSPRLVGDTLVVGHRHLQGLDVRTGAVRWKDPLPWAHYGTPAVADLSGGPDGSGLTVVATPDGRVLDVADGRELARQLADIYYVGPIVEGRRVFWAGGKGHTGDRATNTVVAVDLAPDGTGGLTATTAWTRPLPAPERVYASPLVHDGALWILDLSDTLHGLDTTTGATRASLPLGPALEAAGASASPVAYTQPTAVGTDRLLLGWQSGVLLTVDVRSATPTVVDAVRLPEPSRSTPWVGPNVTYHRTLEHLWAFPVAGR